MPTTQEIEDKVTEIVQDHLDREEPFTAFTITDQTRKEGVSGSHKGMKKIVHNMWKSDEMPSYQRSSVEIYDGQKTYLYHPDKIEPDDAVGFIVRRDQEKQDNDNDLDDSNAI